MPIRWFRHSVGGRVFMGKSDTAPFAGGGLAYNYIEASIDPSRSSVDKGGFAAYGEAGIQFLRTHKSRFSIAVRMDVPMFALKSSYGMGSSYVMPLGVGVSYSFQ